MHSQCSVREELDWNDYYPFSSTCEPIISALILASTFTIIGSCFYYLASLLLLVTVFSWIGFKMMMKFT